MLGCSRQQQKTVIKYLRIRNYNYSAYVAGTEGIKNDEGFALRILQIETHHEQ
ncbi:unnamed protein product [Chironomus riparius]|uniref:Uncharacterized protein n=1 Tax=Chironomus riparius TaxID=315576 RepID=A0A9N9RP30_9DIPT|nr:unnamed protein product [Chironomus riparius]